jgi:hypothetical protein
MRMLFALLALAGLSAPDTVSARADEGGMDLESAVCTTMTGAPVGRNPQMTVRYGPSDQNGSGVLTLLNCTGTTVVKVRDRSPKVRDRAPFVFNATATEKIPGMRGRYHYLNFNQPEMGHVVGLDHWYYAPTKAGDRWNGACVHPVEFTVQSAMKDIVFVNDVDICKTDILILAWSPATM